MPINLEKKVHIKLFGGFRIFDRTGTERPFNVAKGAALIAYLCLSPTGTASRGEITTLLWSERIEDKAQGAQRQSVRKTVEALKTIDPELISKTPKSITLNRDRVTCDVDFLFNEDAALPDSFDLDPNMILKGTESLDPAYYEWLQETRRLIETKLTTFLRKLVDNKEADYETRLSAAESLFKIEPTTEAAAWVLVEHAIKCGDQIKMLEISAILWEALDETWGEIPSPEFQDLVGKARVRLAQTTKTSPPKAENKKYLTILSISISPLGEMNDPEYEYALDAISDTISRIIRNNGGTVLHSDSNEMLAAFGLPNARESDAQACIDTALFLIDTLSDDPKFSFNFGVDSGLTVVNENATTNSPELSGSIVDNAVTLSKNERRGCIHVTEHTLRGLKEGHSDLSRAFSKNPEQPSIIQIVGKDKQTKIIKPNSDLPAFIGRTPYLAALGNTWEEAKRECELRVASIEGPAGVGKTSLVLEFLNRLQRQHTQIAWVSCAQYDRQEPLGPIFELINQLGKPDHTGKSEPKNNESLPKSVASDMAETLYKALGDEPSVLFLDDWQWVDDATRFTINDFSTKQFKAPVLIILTSRETPEEEWLTAMSHPILLPNLTALETYSKLDVLIDKPLGQRMKQGIFAMTGGNPLYLEELCHALSNAKIKEVTEDLLKVLPANISALIASRIERLNKEDHEIVFAASVHGDQVETDLLSAVLGYKIPGDALFRLRSLDVFKPGNSNKILRFKHGIAREVTYGMIPYERRKELHLAYTKHLLADGSKESGTVLAEKLALHYRGGGDRENAIHFSEVAGDKALKTSALDQAMYYYETALDLIANDPTNQNWTRWTSIALRCAIPYVYAASHEYLPVLERAESLAERSNDDYSTCSARYWLGYLQFVLGKHKVSVQSLERAGRVAIKLQDKRMIAEIQAIKGCALAACAEYAEARIEMQKSISAKNLNPKKSRSAPVTSVYTRANLALIEADQCNFKNAEQLISEALERVDGYEHEVESSILNYAGAINLWKGNWELALRQAVRSRERSEKVSSPYLMGMSRSIWGFATWKQSWDQKGIELLKKSAEFMEETGMELYLSLIKGWLAEALLENGDFDEVRVIHQSNMSRIEDGEIMGLSMSARAAAICDLETGNHKSALEHLETAESSATKRASPHEELANSIVSSRIFLSMGYTKKAAEKLMIARQLCETTGLKFRLAEIDAVENLLT